MAKPQLSSPRCMLSCAYSAALLSLSASLLLLLAEAATVAVVASTIPFRHVIALIVAFCDFALCMFIESSSTNSRIIKVQSSKFKERGGLARGKTTRAHYTSTRANSHPASDLGTWLSGCESSCTVQGTARAHRRRAAVCVSARVGYLTQCETLVRLVSRLACCTLTVHCHTAAVVGHARLSLPCTHTPLLEQRPSRACTSSGQHSLTTLQRSRRSRLPPLLQL